MLLRHLLLTILTVLIVGASATLAVAQDELSRQWSSCSSQQEPDVKIGACTAVIQSGELSSAGLRDAFDYRGYAYYSRGDCVRALADFNSALGVDSQFAYGYFHRGLIYYHCDNNGAAAVPEFNRAVQLNADARARQLFVSYLANAHGRAGNRQMQLSILDEQIRLTPNDADLLNSRCWARAEWGQQLDLARADCDASLSIRPNDGGTLDSRGLVHLRRGDFQAAFADYHRAFLATDQASQLYGRGVALLRLGRTDEGQADITAANVHDAGVAERFAGYGIASAEVTPAQIAPRVCQRNAAYDLTELPAQVRSVVEHAREAQRLARTAAQRARSGGGGSVYDYAPDGPEFAGYLYEGEWSGGTRNGYGSFHVSPPNRWAGWVYEGTWLEGQYRLGVDQRQDGSRFEGTFIGTRSYGYGVLWDAQGNTVYAGIFRGEAPARLLSACDGALN